MRQSLKIAAAILVSSIAASDAQTVFPSGYPAATSLSGAEVVFGNQGGNPVDISINQIKSFIGSANLVAGVTTFNGRGGVVSLQSTDISTALGASPLLSTNNLSDLANIGTARTNLGLGTSATVNTGTSGATIPLLTTNNTFNGITTFTGTTVSSRRTVNASTTLSAATDNFVCGDVSGGVITLTMPPNTIPNGTTIGINDCKRQSATHTLTIAANVGQTISGSASIAITTNGGALIAVWNSTDNDWNLF